MIRAALLENPPPISRGYVERRRILTPAPKPMPLPKAKKKRNVCTNKGKKIQRAPKYPWDTLEVGQLFFVVGKDHKSLGPTRRHADQRYGIETIAFEGRFRGAKGIYIRRVA